MISKVKKKAAEPPKARIGRPPVAEEARRDTMVRVLVNQGEHAELQRAAEAAAMSLSAWIRVVALERARRGTA